MVLLLNTNVLILLRTVSQIKVDPHTKQLVSMFYYAVCSRTPPVTAKVIPV